MLLCHTDDIGVMNKDLVICHLDEGATLNMELMVETGKGCGRPPRAPHMAADAGGSPHQPTVAAAANRPADAPSIPWRRCTPARRRSGRPARPSAGSSADGAALRVRDARPLTTVFYVTTYCVRRNLPAQDGRRRQWIMRNT